MAAQASKPKGQVSGDYYSPPKGDLRCKILGGAEYGRIKEKFTAYGGVVSFVDDDFAYRVDYQQIAGTPLSPPKSDAVLDSRQSDYLHKAALPLTLSDTPGGALVSEGARAIDSRRIYYGVLHYANATNESTLASWGPHYVAVVVYLTPSYAYTVTAQDVDRASNGRTSDQDIESAILTASAHFKNCSFGKGL